MRVIRYEGSTIRYTGAVGVGSSNTVRASVGRSSPRTVEAARKCVLDELAKIEAALPPVVGPPLAWNSEPIGSIPEDDLQELSMKWFLAWRVWYPRQAGVRARHRIRRILGFCNWCKAALELCWCDQSVR